RTTYTLTFGRSLSRARNGDLRARLLLAEEGPQLARGLGRRRGSQLALTVAQPRDDVLLAPIRVRLRVVVARMATAALLAEQRRPRHRLGAEEHRPQVEREVPRRVVHASARDRAARRARAERVDARQRLTQLVGGADDPDEVLHRVGELGVQRVRVLAAAPLEGREDLLRSAAHLL